MALFKKTKKATTEQKKETVKKPVNPSAPTIVPVSVLKDPRITEKASLVNAQGVYVFNVPFAVTKLEVARAVKALYNVVPLKVNMVRVASRVKASRTRQTPRLKKGGKKAYVYLKPGDTIEFV